MLTITIIRNNGFYGLLRSAQIMADDKEIGRVNSGESVTVQLPAHSKNLYAKMDWGWSTAYPASQVIDGQTLYMNARFSFNPFRNLGIATIPIKIENKPR